MSDNAPRFLEFDSFRLDLHERKLLHNGELIPVTGKVFETLLVLIQNRGQVLDKDVLMKTLWPDSFVEESNLAQHVSVLRKALRNGDSARQYIETIPKRGYKFVADVHEIPDEEKVEVREEKRAWVSRKWRVSIAAACVVVTLISIFVLWRWSTSANKEDDLTSQSIAIVPFRTVGIDSDKDVLGLGMADTLISKLSKLKKLTVLPTSSVFKYMAKQHDARAIGLELGTDFVLDGTVQRSGERVRVSAQLTRVADGSTFWAGHFDEEFTNIFAIHDSISEHLAQALAQRLTRRDSEELAKTYTKNAEAYEAYVTGLYFWNKRTRAALSEAIVYFEKAVHKDPSFGLAFAMLSDTYFLSLRNQFDIVPPDTAEARFIENAKRAFDLDPSLAETHMTMAAVKKAEGDFEGEHSEYRDSLDRNPSFATARLRYSYSLFESLRPNEALEQMKMAQELDPVSPTTNAALCYMLTISRREDDAIKYCRRALELDPQVIDGHLNLGEAYVQKRLFDDAIAEFEKARDDRPLLALRSIAYAQAMAGRRDDAYRTLASISKLPDSSKVDYSLFLTLLGLDDVDGALKSLDALPQTRFLLAMLKFDPRLDTLREDGRFISFLRNKQLDHLLAD